MKRIVKAERQRAKRKEQAPWSYTPERFLRSELFPLVHRKFALFFGGRWYQILEGEQLKGFGGRLGVGLLSPLSVRFRRPRTASSALVRIE